MGFHWLETSPSRGVRGGCLQNNAGNWKLAQNNVSQKTPGGLELEESICNTSPGAKNFAQRLCLEISDTESCDCGCNTTSSCQETGSDGGGELDRKMFDRSRCRFGEFGHRVKFAISWAPLLLQSPAYNQGPVQNSPEKPPLEAGRGGSNLQHHTGYTPDTGRKCRGRAVGCPTHSAGRTGTTRCCPSTSLDTPSPDLQQKARWSQYQTVELRIQNHTHE